MPQAVAILVCLVVGISDGDTLTARCESAEGPQTHRVRLAEIDAPEARQPWGQRSRQALAALCFQQHAEVRSSGTDRNGRVVGHVLCNGVDSSDAQVRAGMAWVHDRYVQDRGLYKLQAQAQQAQLGLWGDEAPVPPWVWRHDRRRTP